MPEESINIFISNIYATAIFAGVFIFIFLAMFITSRILISRSKDQVFVKHGEDLPVRPFSLMHLGKDTQVLKTLFVSGLIFVYLFFLILLILLSMHFATGFKIDGSLYLIFVIIFLILVTTVYVIKSGIIKR